MTPLFSDENFSLRVVRELRLLGHDVMTTREAGLLGTADPNIFQAAASTHRAILTNDRRDYMRLHRLNPDHPGIIICTYDVDIVRLVRRIHAAIVSNEPLDGKLIRVTRPGPTEADA
jgi:hypothetical protein